MTFLISIFVVGVASMSCLSGKETKDRKQPTDIRFRTINKIPIVEARLNGKKANFILDTGASISLLNEKEAGYYGFKVFYLNKEISGLNGLSTFNGVYKYSIEIGSLNLANSGFKSTDLSHISNAVYKTEKIRIAGIIGSDIFVRYNMNIDYKGRSISHY